MFDSNLTRVFTVVALFAAVVLLFAGNGSFGIWDPWELDVSERVTEAPPERTGGEGTSTGTDNATGAELIQTEAPLSFVMAGASISALGVSESAGRAPFAFAALLLLIGAFLVTARYDSVRTGAYAALVLVTTPVLLFNGKGMFGDAFAMAGNAAVGLCAAGIAFGNFDGEKGKQRLGLWATGLVAAIVFAVFAGGVLSSVAPPLMAVGVVAGVRAIGLSDPKERLSRSVSIVMFALGLIVFVGVGYWVFYDAEGYSAWLGGRPIRVEPPTFDKGLERVFHGFGAWAGLMVVGLARLLAPAQCETSPASEVPEKAASDESTSEPNCSKEPLFLLPDAAAAFRMSVLLWAAFGYVALMIYTARYGVTTYHSVAPLGIAVAVLLRDVERSGTGWWGEAVVASLFVVLILRDYALFPNTTVDSLAIADLTVPEVFNPKSSWTVFLGLFIAAQALALAAGRWQGERPDLLAPYRYLKARWNEGGETSLPGPLKRVPPAVRRFLPSTAARAWLVLTILALVGCLAFGIFCYAAGADSGLPHITVRAGKKLVFLPLLVPVAIAGVQLVFFAVGKLGQYRLVPLFAVALAVGAYTSFGYLPALSAHFSPREVYDALNDLHQEGQPFAEFEVGIQAATYYSDVIPESLQSESELVSFLNSDSPAWAVIPDSRLARVDATFREQTGRHLFVANTESARIRLVSGVTPAGEENGNPLLEVVLDELPELDVTVGTVFRNAIELAGYNLDLPGDRDVIGAGEEFVITWYYRVINRVPGSYQSFVHMDGHGNRLNGDHEVTEGVYPMSYWRPGDIIADRQELTVPANYRPGDYHIFMGFFSGNSRLDVTAGPTAGDNRAQAGILEVR